VSLVNPPPRPRLPKAFLNDPEVRGYVEQLQTIIFQLYQRTGGEDDTIDTDTGRILELENQVGENFNSFVQQLFKVKEGLPAFTIDTTGFTTDITLITTDKVIA
jgi:hypothetical protein